MGLKIKKIEKIYTEEPAYDVSVQSSSHNFQLKNGVFVHNSLKIPKQYLGDTDDSAGFNGGTSLSLISSRYAKTIKRIQSCMIQAITDVINILLLDKGLDSYINKFTIRMQTPTTQEERDRQDTIGSKINTITDIMNLMDNVGVSNDSNKLKIFKVLLSNVISDTEITDILQDQLDELEVEQTEQPKENDENDNPVVSTFNDRPDININNNIPSGGIEPEEEINIDQQENNGEEMILPTPQELDAGDFTDMNNP